MLRSLPYCILCPQRLHSPRATVTRISCPSLPSSVSFLWGGGVTVEPGRSWNSCSRSALLAVDCRDGAPFDRGTGHLPFLQTSLSFFLLATKSTQATLDACIMTYVLALMIDIAMVVVQKFPAKCAQYSSKNKRFGHAPLHGNPHVIPTVKINFLSVFDPRGPRCSIMVGWSTCSILSVCTVHILKTSFIVSTILFF